ncbi:hybrid sensor histidine kinase [Fomitopsis betulina]|nr:hybrid sensor histidine kinase [Fomitopsis betulina]
MPFRSRTSLTAVPNDSDHDIPIPFLNDKGSPGNLEKTASMGAALSDTLVGSSLPTPVVQSRRGKKNARIERGLKVHWAYFKRRLGTVTAPSTSSAFEPDDGDSYTTGQAPLLHMGEDEADGVDEVVVDREWSQEMKSSITHSEYGTPDRASNAFGTTIDRESLFAHPEGRWAKFGPLVLLRWRCWPVVYDFFVSRFVDAKSERHYNRENWFLKKNLALWSSAFLVVNWVLAVAFLQRPGTIVDTIFVYAVAPSTTIPMVVWVMFNFPRDRSTFYQCWAVFAIWQWAFYSVITMYLCGYYTGMPVLSNCGKRDYLNMFYYTSALQTVGLFGLKLNRFPAMIAAASFFIVASGLIIPTHQQMVRNMINFLCFQTFLLYIHFMRENAERRLYALRDQLKIQFRATQKAQVNERKAADSKRRLTSYVFHEVRVPLNTALLAVQNMEASLSIAKSQEIEFKALEGSLSMMSKVLNDVLDFNRMDSGRFESVLKPYSFHKVMRSMLLPLRLATDARGLEFVVHLDDNIDVVARKALHEALGDVDDTDDAEDGVVVGDETRLRQIITNLASNACKFTPAGGKLTMTTKLLLPDLSRLGESNVVSNELETKESQEIPIDLQCPVTPPMSQPLSSGRLTQHNKTLSKTLALEWIVVRIEVTDTGYGIRPSDMVQSKLFSAFNQTEQGRLQGGKGTGLGLALVRQIVKRSGGRLGVQSKVGVGSTFWVELPLGVGVKATPVFTMPRDDFLETPSNMTRAMRSATQCDLPVTDSPHDSHRVSHKGSPQSASALHSIMEQGGLVEISTKRDSRGEVLTRTIGDTSTGTQTLFDDTASSTPTGSQDTPPLPIDSLSVSTTARPEIPPSSRPRASTFDSLVPPPGSSITSPAEALSTAEEPLRVLVVDDDLLTRKLMSRMLTRIGCKVSTAEHGGIALGMILRTGRPSTEEEDAGSAAPSADGQNEEYQYAVIFLDNQMPVLSGLDVVTKLREMGRKDFVVGVTGNALLTDQKGYLEAGADHVLTKPVLEKSLRGMLAIADKRQKRRQARLARHARHAEQSQSSTPS